MYNTSNKDTLKITNLEKELNKLVQGRILYYRKGINKLLKKYSNVI